MIICLAGVGRSGTSLLASYFQHCGIHMGERLLEAGGCNKRGFYEDRDFLELHKSILVYNKTNMYVPRKNLILADEHRMRALQLLDSRSSQHKVWGWKEPRTSLFLDFWAELSPDIKFIFMYREPYQTIESILRSMQRRYLYVRPWLGPMAWIHYNRKLLQFFHENPGRAVFASINRFNAAPEAGSKKLGEWLNIEFTRPYSDVYHPEDMTSGENKEVPFPIDIYMWLARSIFDKRLNEIYDEIRKCALI